MLEYVGHSERVSTPNFIYFVLGAFLIVACMEDVLVPFG
jgi:hypothetical protein